MKPTQGRITRVPLSDPIDHRQPLAAVSWGETTQPRHTERGNHRDRLQLGAVTRPEQACMGDACQWRRAPAAAAPADAAPAIREDGLGPRFSPARLPRFVLHPLRLRLSVITVSRLGSDSVQKRFGASPPLRLDSQTNRQRSKTKNDPRKIDLHSPYSCFSSSNFPLRQSGSNPPAQTVPPRPGAMTASAPAAARARPSAWRPTAVTSVATTAAMTAVTTTVAGPSALSFPQRDPAN